jgi:thermitase
MPFELLVFYTTCLESTSMSRGRRFMLLIIAALLLMRLSLYEAAAQSVPLAEFDPHHIIVKFKAKSNLLARAASSVQIPRFQRIIPLKRDAGARTQPLPRGVERIFVAEISAGTNLEEILKELSANPEVEYAEPDYIGRGDGGQNLRALVQSDPDLYMQWGLQNKGQLGGKPGIDVNAIPAWDITTGGDDTILAVLDTGLALNAPDFTGRILSGYDFANNDSDPADDYGHGTNVTSIAAATGNNGIAIAGMNWKCRILPIKILDSHNLGDYSWWVSGFIYAAEHGARVINISAGGIGRSQALADAVAFAQSRGVIVVACMMNANGETPYYPAAYPEVIAVGGINSRGLRAVPFCYSVTSGSNYGNHISFVAPGDSILGVNYLNVNGSSYWCGTSQATPFVSGLITLLLAVNPALAYPQVYEALKAGARDQIGTPSEDTAGWDKYFGWGLIDAYRTLLDVAKTAGLFAQVAVGGGYSTTFTVVNTGSESFSGALVLTGDDATPLVATLKSAGYQDAVSSSFALRMPPGGTQIITAGAVGQEGVNAGWARIVGSGGTLGGVATFQLMDGGQLVTAVGVVASLAVNSAVVPIDDDGTLGVHSRATGYAVANPGATGIRVRIVLMNTDGSIALTLSPPQLNPLCPGCHVARFLWEELGDPSLQFKGSMILSAEQDEEFSVAALVLNQGLYTAIPVITSKVP